MILDDLENKAQQCRLNGGFQKAFEFLSRTDLRTLSAGRWEIDGDRVFALISRGPGRRKQDAQLEIHEQYIDIQYIIAGTDEMGWKPKSGCRKPAGEYDPDKDIRFFSDAPDVWFTVRPGLFTIFFPEDAHLPLISEGEVHKVVIKVAVEHRNQDGS